jgi:hypothetical protein
MKMRYLFFFSLALALSAPLAAQDLMDKLADATCTCITQKDVDNMDAEMLQMQLGFCIMEAVSKYNDEFQKAYGQMDPTDAAAMSSLGEQIGMKMAFKCPAVLMKVAAVETQVEVRSAAPAATETLSGTVKAIEDEGGFAQITVLDEAGRTHKLLWLRYFKGDTRFINEPGKVVNAKVRVKYENVEVYSPKAKEYFNRKEIRELEFLR